MSDEAESRIRAAGDSGATALDLSGCGLDMVPTSLRELTGLTTLSLANNWLTTVPAWLSELTGLTTVNLLGNRLEEVPRALNGLSGLTVLYLGGNRVSSLPDWLGEHTALTYLSTGNNQLTTVPTALGNLKELAYLSLANNRLTSLPDSLASLVGLETLTIGSNAIGVAPEWLRMLINLRILSLNRTGLREVPVWLGDLASLTYLHVGANRLKELPEALAALTGLTTFYIGDNPLTELPDWLASLADLRILAANKNRLSSLPDRLGELSNLTNLNLADNQLTELPESMRRLTGLARLDLANNQLTSLPDWLGDLKKLDTLNLGGNLLSEPPAEIRAEGTAAILAFLRASQAGSAPQWKSKLLVVGEGGVGKTSLIKALQGVRHDPSEQTTHGMDVSELLLDHPDLNGVQMSLAAWDFGGQEIYHATHQFFLTGQSLILLVWNPRTGHEQSRVRYWLDIIKARAPESIVLIVATHGDERHPDGLPFSDLQREYPFLVGGRTVDTGSGHGIDELLQELSSRAAGLPLMGQVWPLAWTAAANLVNVADRDHVTDNALRDLLSSAGIQDYDDQSAFARVLHKLGTILYHDDDEALADIVVLKPGWLNTNIALMLDDAGPADRNGVLTKEDRDRVWSGVEPSVRDHFLAMMERFDLCYRIRDSARDGIAIVVDRLPHQAPDRGDAWSEPATRSGGGELKVKYVFDIMPPGIPTWFIARENRFATDVHWRDGALLRDRRGAHEALIRADRERKTVELVVRGPMPATFFSILDDGLNVTLDRYPGLTVRRQVPCTCQKPGICPEYYEYGFLFRCVERGKDQIDCRESLQSVAIQSLLSGIAPARRDIVPLSADDLRRVVGEAVSAGQREILKALRGSQKAHCPSVFTIVPSNKRRPGKTLYTLRLYCEEPGAWHSLPDDAGCYEITELDEWLRKYGLGIQRTLAILSRVVPVVGTALGAAAHGVHGYGAHGQLKTDFEKTRELIASHHLPPHLALLDNADPLGEIGAEATAQPLAHAQTDADFRVLAAMLHALDPAERWGGLNRVPTPEGLSVYLCPEHAETYR